MDESLEINHAYGNEKDRENIFFPCLLVFSCPQQLQNPGLDCLKRRCEMGMGILHRCFGGCGFTSRNQPSTTTMEYLGHRFSLDQLRKSTDDFDESRKIGKGPYGSMAYRGCISINGQLKHVAVKRLGGDKSGISPEGISMYKNDILFMCQLHHPNLASFVGFCDDHNEILLVYEYAPNGSLHQQLYGRERKSPTLSWKKRVEISIGVARGLHYLHSGTKRTIIHRRIASTTILLDENWVPKLYFFGFSLKGPKYSEKSVKPIKLESVAGGFGYMAPENFLPSPNVTYKCDVFSFGVVLLKLICGKTLSQISLLEGRPINSANVLSFTVSVVEKIRNLGATGNGEGIIDERLKGEIAAECFKLYMEITESCLCEDPNERPDMGDVEVQLEDLLQLQEQADTNQSLMI